MKTIEQVRLQLFSGQFEFSRHAFKRAVERNISDMEIRQAGANAKIIEDYPDDKYDSPEKTQQRTGLKRKTKARWETRRRI